VLCRIYKKSNMQRPVDRERNDLIEEMIKQQKLMQTCYSTKPANPSMSSFLMDQNNEQNVFASNTSTPRPELYSLSPVPCVHVDRKRDLPSSLYWPSDDQMGSVASSTSKQFHHLQSDQPAGSASTEGNTSFTSILNQMAQGNNVATFSMGFGSSLVVESIGDVVPRPPFQNSGGTWNS